MVGRRLGRGAATAIGTAIAMSAIMPPTAGADASWCKHAHDIPVVGTVAEARRATLCLINQERIARGIPLIHTQSSLRTVAKRYARELVRKRRFAHESANGASVLDRVKRTNYKARAAHFSLGETLAWGIGPFSTPFEIVDAWMHSREHKRLILDRRFTEMGIGVTLGTPEGDDYTFHSENAETGETETIVLPSSTYTAVFAAPRR